MHLLYMIYNYIYTYIIYNIIYVLYMMYIYTYIYIYIICWRARLVARRNRKTGGPGAESTAMAGYGRPEVSLLVSGGGDI